LLFILFLLFVPIPFKFDIYFSFNNYYIKLYGLTIISKDKIKKRKNKSLKEKVFPPIKKEKIKLKKNSIKILLSKLYHRPFKPKLYINSCFSYSLNDAFKTALSFGALNNIKTPVYILLNVIFKVRKFKFKVDPSFKDEYFIDCNTTSIFFLSLAELIYILFIVLKHLHISKEVTPDN
ncbi:MAG: DUF2953 domain-containing protein, partial [Romboutsia sp.]|nr:DUF2953 domain-containing protein [Romboutsia sp.]